MRGFIITLAVLLTITGGQAQDTIDGMWDRANTAYVNADYQTAIATYDSIVDAGYTGHKLYYNLGNAYFKEGKIGKSILNYNRALQIMPSDPDVKHNLKIVNSYVKDNIETVPEFFLYSWVKAWRQTMSSDGWAVMSIVMFGLSLACALVFLLMKSIRLRKAGFYGAIAAFVVAVFAVSFAVAEKRDLTKSGEAVIMISAAAVKSSPDNMSKDIFILHEGTKVNVVSSLGDWREIAIADGNKGWIQASAIETVAILK